MSSSEGKSGAVDNISSVTKRLLTSPKLLVCNQGPLLGSGERWSQQVDEWDDLSKRISERFHLALLPTGINVPPQYANVDFTEFVQLQEAGHIYTSTVENAFMDLVKMGRNQTILIAGTNGGQQPFLHRAIARHLIDLTKPGSAKKSKVHSAALKLHTIFNQLWHVRENDALSSQADFVVTYQLDAHGALVGFNTKVFGANYRSLANRELGKKALVFSELFSKASPTERVNFGISTLHTNLFGTKDSTAEQKSVPGSILGSLKELRACFKTLGIATSEAHQNQLLGLFGAIEILQTLEFHVPSGSQDVAASVVNRENLTIAADLLGVTTNELEAGLTYQTEALQKDFASKPLDATQSRGQRDLLVTCIYQSTCEWVIHQINRKHSSKLPSTASMTVVQLAGWSAEEKASAVTPQSLSGLINAYFAERVLQSIYTQVIEAPLHLYQVEFQQQNQLLSELTYNSPLISVIADPSSGLLAKLKEKPSSPGTLARKSKEVVASYPGHVKVIGESQVSMRHTWGYDSLYSLDQVVEDNVNSKNFLDDTMRLFVGAACDNIQNSLPNTGSKNSVVRSLMQLRAVTFLASEEQGFFFKSLVELKELFEEIEECNIWSVFTTAAKDAQALKRLQRGLLIPDLARASVQLAFPFDVPRNDIAAKFGTAFASGIADTTTLAGSLGLAPSLVAVGPNRWFLSEVAFGKFIQLTGGLYKNDLSGQLNWLQTSSYVGDDYDGASDVGSEMSGFSGISLNMNSRLSDVTANNKPIVAISDPSLTLDKHLKAAGQSGGSGAQENTPVTSARKRWLCCTWCATWWIPSIFLKWCGGMKRKDIQIAWREKVTLNILVYLTCMIVLMAIIGLNRILCPNTLGKNPGELSNYNKTDQRVYAYGIWLKVSSLESMPYHSGYSFSDWHGVLGIDVTGMFPKSRYYSKYCPLMTTADGGIDVYSHQLDAALSQIYYQHTVSSTTDSWASAVSKCKQGPVYMGKEDYQALTDQSRYWFIINDYLYDLSGYVVLGSYPVTLQYKFLGDTFNKLIVQASLGSGADMSKAYNSLLAKNRSSTLAAMNCLNNLFKIAQVDHRKDAQCVVTNWILLSASIVIACAIGFKFIAALQLPSRATPEDFDKFVLVQVPCYTEGPESIAKTVESVAALKYDDKHKLLFVICDGMIIGSGNDRPTPRIVLDIFGVNEDIDPTPLSYQAVAEGSKQHNMAKIYSGLYSFEGHHIPFITLVKVGTPAEKARPGNRGKRDSQLILMRFLQKVYFQMPMTPMELELFHQIKNVIGVHPSFYEFVLMIDADTYVLADSLNKLVAAMVRDSKVLGICGETELANERESWITMIQVYEYFISHYLAKAFESMFNSVTCLPGCFCMYRVRTSGVPGAKTSPLLVSNTIIDAYSETNVNTLHKKNLLHLGEDRYLTTLLLKTFPNYKTCFTANAQCRTVAPNKWSVLLSQRRRWINSTVHNLFELMLLQDLCGFFCFSLRFVVFLDLFGTVTQPAALIYIVYLIVVSCVEDNTFPQISIIMIACIYGLPILLFLFKRQFEHIGWMLLYILAQPLYGVFMPLYAFWHFDDFSWGNTRMIIGDDGKSKAFVADAEKFDPSIIPKKPFEDYERELIAQQEAMAVDQGHMQPPMTGVIGGSEVSFQQHRLSQYTITNPVYFGGELASARGLSDGASEHTVDVDDSISHTGSYIEYPHAVSSYNQVLNQVRSRPNSQAMAPEGAVGGPSDAELIAGVKAVLANADLMTITKRQVRDRLSNEFFGGFNLNTRKDFINHVIDQVLQGQL